MCTVLCVSVNENWHAYVRMYAYGTINVSRCICNYVRIHVLYVCAGLKLWGLTNNSKASNIHDPLALEIYVSCT